MELAEGEEMKRSNSSARHIAPLYRLQLDPRDGSSSCVHHDDFPLGRNADVAQKSKV